MTFTIYEKMFQITNQTFFFPYFFLWTWSLAGPECKKDTKVDGNLVFFWFVTIFYFSQFFQHTNRPPKKRCSTFKKVGATTGALLVLRMDIFWDPSSVKTSPSHVKPQMRFSKNRGAPKSFPKIRLYYVLIRAMTCNDSNDSIWKPTFWGDNEPLFWECTSHW